MGTKLVTGHWCEKAPSPVGEEGERDRSLSHHGTHRDSGCPLYMVPLGEGGAGPLPVTGCQLHPFLLHSPHTVEANPQKRCGKYCGSLF